MVPIYRPNGGSGVAKHASFLCADYTVGRKKARRGSRRGVSVSEFGHAYRRPRSVSCAFGNSTKEVDGTWTSFASATGQVGGGRIKYRRLKEGESVGGRTQMVTQVRRIESKESD